MFCRPTATPEQECHKAPAALGTQVAVYEDSIGQLILQWLRKPTYWSEGVFRQVGVSCLVMYFFRVGAGAVLLDSSLIPSPPIMPQDRARVDDP